jgi:hypothetical protein
MRLRRRAFILVICLFITALLFVMGLAFLNRGSNHYKSAREAQSAVQARALAWAGLEQVRAKLDKDLYFPPLMGEDQLSLTYEEDVLDLDGVTRLGSVVITLDRTYASTPYYLLRVTSKGLSRLPAEPSARSTLVADFDISEWVRGTTNAPNPNRYSIINLTDLSGF